jgi:hypothetical protein
MSTSNKGSQSSSVRCLWLQFNVAEIKKPPGAPAANNPAYYLLLLPWLFYPLFCQLLMRAEGHFEVTPAMLATFTTCF